MRIASVEPVHLRIPFDQPRSVDAGSPPATGSRLHLLRLETDDGAVAWGEAAAGSAAEMDDAVEMLASALIDAEVLDRGTLWERMVDRLMGEKEPPPGGAAALSAVDLALWDLAARAVDLPVYQMIGGTHRARLEACAVGISENDPEAAARQAQEMRARGFHAVTLPVDGDLERDVAMLDAVREALGPQARLLVDARQRLESCDQAMELGAALDRHEVFWYEEPLPPDDWTDYVSLRHALNTPLAGGERLRSPGAFLQALLRGALDVVTPDVRLCGGITGLLKIADLARWFGVRLSPHNEASQIGLIASTHVALTLPNSVMTAVEIDALPLTESLLQTPPGFDAGFIVLPDGPGLGIRVNQSFIAEHAT